MQMPFQSITDTKKRAMLEEEAPYQDDADGEVEGISLSVCIIPAPLSRANAFVIVHWCVLLTLLCMVVHRCHVVVFRSASPFGIIVCGIPIPPCHQWPTATHRGPPNQHPNSHHYTNS